MRKKLTFDSVRALLGIEQLDLPTYVAPLLNLANQYAQGTRPRVVGQMSELIREFPGETFAEWEEWYKKQQPSALEEATDRIWRTIQKLKSAVNTIDRQMVRTWADDLVLAKTFVGLRFQAAVLREVAKERGATFELAGPSDESRGIDGYVGGRPVSIKPSTYKSKGGLPETIDCEVIYYEKCKDGILIDFETEGQ